jgi:hypothetical protein
MDIQPLAWEKWDEWAALKRLGLTEQVSFYATMQRRQNEATSEQQGFALWIGCM